MMERLLRGSAVPHAVRSAPGFAQRKFRWSFALHKVGLEGLLFLSFLVGWFQFEAT
jgi:hypothetical protein